MTFHFLRASSDKKNISESLFDTDQNDVIQESVEKLIGRQKYFQKRLPSEIYF